MITSKTSLLPVALMALLSMPVTAQSLPGGASAVNEVHGDWVVACATQAETVRCALSHNQLSNDANRSRILAIELTAVDPDGVTKGAMALPFGLRLDAGITIAVDEQVQNAARFSTCLPVGCIVPLTFDTGAMATMKAGETMTISATIEDSGQETKFSIPLNGMASGLERMSMLEGAAQAR